jgi:starvation-inducible DNA-binding protein
MRKTRNNIPETVRFQVIGLIQDRLAESIDLITHAKNAHWNVKGPDFIALHKFFDEIAEVSEGYADLIAERIAQLGGTPEGTLMAASKRTTLPSYPPKIYTGKDHISALSATLAAYGERARKTVDQVNEIHDVDTADIFTEISRSVDKYLWLVESHNQQTE